LRIKNLFDLDRYYSLLGDFEIENYLKLDAYDITYEFEVSDFLEYKEKLSSKIQKIDLKDYKSLKDILELAGTMSYFLNQLITSMAHESFFSDKHEKHVERKVVNDANGNPTNLYTNQLEDVINEFTDVFEKKVLMIGVIYEYKGNILENIDIDEKHIINEYNELDFSQLEAFLKLYEEGELD
jgi:hypothetical protein